MSRLLLVLVIALSGISAAFIPENDYPDCTDWEIKVVKEKKEDGHTDVRIEVEGATEKVHFVLYEKSGTLVSREFTSNEFKGLKPGEYGYTVVGAKGCNVTGEFELE